MRPAATRNPIGGDRTSQVTTFPTSLQRTPLKPPAAAIPAPTRPPTEGWVELLGSPAYQVTRFHTVAPSRAAMMTPTVGWASSLAIVLETALPKKMTVTRAPTRLKTADIGTAILGERARVEMEVAMALAVSWKPLVKSKTSAAAMAATSSASVIAQAFLMAIVLSTLATCSELSVVLSRRSET